MQCYVAKNRPGRMGKFNTVFCKTYNRFEEARFHPDLVEQYEMIDEEESKPRWMEECEAVNYPPTLKYLMIAYSTMQTQAPINECIGFHCLGPIGIAR